MCKATKLSVVVVTRNEEDNIAQCLESVRWADEIIVVDSCSTDKTVEIAKQYTDKVFVISRSKLDANINKNFGMKKATGDWILFLDADEIVTPEARTEIGAILREDGRFDGYLVLRKNLFLGKWMRHGGAWGYAKNIELVRGWAGEWPIGMHKSFLIHGSVGRLRNPVIHNWTKSISQWIQKMDEYTSVEAMERKTGFSAWRMLLYPPAMFCRNFFLKAGFRDGRHGFVAAVLAAIYAFVKQAKLWEKSLEE